MKFLLYVEGETEKLGLPGFLRRCLSKMRNDAQLPNIGIGVYKFDGWTNFEKRVAETALSQLSTVNSNEIIAVIGLLDLHGPIFTADQSLSVNQRVAAGQKMMNEKVAHSKYRQHFAVHDVEAWLLSQPEIFPTAMHAEIRKKIKPESVNGKQPPGDFLNSLYQKHFGRPYRKTIQGPKLFEALDPQVAYSKCPHLKMMLDDMLKLAQSHCQ